MRRILAAVVLIGVILSGAILIAGEAALVLPPHPLDSAFKADTEKAVGEAITKSDLFKKAVSEALAAKKKQEEASKKQNLAGPTPAQAARTKFLEVLRNDKAEE